MKKTFYIAFLIFVVFSCTGKKQDGGVKGGTEVPSDPVSTLDEVENLAYVEDVEEEKLSKEYSIAYVKEGELYFFSMENQSVVKFTEESDTIFNCAFSDNDDILYYTVSQNGMLSLKKLDFSVTSVQISLLKELERPTKEFLTQTYGEKAKLNFFNSNLLLESDFSWDVYSFSKYLEYIPENNTISILDWEMFFDNYVGFIERNEPAKDYNHIYNKTRQLFFSDASDDGDEIEFYFTEETVDESKIIFSVLTGFGDLPHGPYCVANADGSMINILEDTDMGLKFKPTWSNNNAVYIRDRVTEEHERIKELCYTIESTNETVVIDSNVDYYMVRK